MDISIIVPTNRPAQSLGALADSLGELVFSGSYEVIVVANGDTDTTSEIRQLLCAAVKNLKVVWEKHTGLHNARHRGVREASAELLAFIDDDVRLTPQWLEGVMESFSSPDVALVGGNIFPDYEVPPPDWILRMWRESSCSFGNYLFYLSILDFGNVTREIPPEYVFGCNFSIRKKMLIEAGGFHPDAMPKELLRFRGDGETSVASSIIRYNAKVLFNPKTSLYHKIGKNRLTTDYFSKRAFEEGITKSFAECRLRYYAVNDIDNAKTVSVPKPACRRESGTRRSLFFLKKLFLFLTDYKYNEQMRSFHKSYCSGYDFHQHEFHTNPEVREWVLRDDYCDSPLE